MDTSVTFNPSAPAYVVPAHLTLVGVISRFFAFAIDVIIALSLDWAVFLTYHIVTQRPLSEWEGPFFQLLYGLIWMGYNILLTHSQGQTFGGKLFRTKVVSEDGKNLTLLQIVARETIGRFLSTSLFDIGYLWSFFDKNRQTWHDLLAKTIVIKV